MKDISSFLEKFKNIKNPLLEKQAIVSVINSIAHSALSPKDIKIQSTTLFVTVNPYVRSEIYLRKQLILDGLVGVSTTKISDIR